jgi:hypothetical protein
MTLGKKGEGNYGYEIRRLHEMKKLLIDDFEALREQVLKLERTQIVEKVFQPIIQKQTYRKELPL